jgi:hypothetical protein
MAAASRGAYKPWAKTAWVAHWAAVFYHWRHTILRQYLCTKCDTLYGSSGEAARCYRGHDDKKETHSMSEARQSTGLLDRNLKRIYLNDTIRVGMRRGDDAGWTTGRVVFNKGPEFYSWSAFRLVDDKTGEYHDMQLDQELRELVG